jgi:hypothetical protein
MMSFFLDPKGIIQKIRTKKREFLWRGAETRKKWALVAWEKVCKLKRKGGLGLHDPQATNEAYGVKLWWRWVKETTTPWVNLWKAKYSLDISDQNKIRFRGTREIINKPQQMENLEHSHSTDKRLDCNSNKRGGGGIGEPKNSIHGWQ